MSLTPITLPLPYTDPHLSLPGNNSGKIIGNDSGNAISPFTLSRAPTIP
ncbi:MAG TPA: hypothetical protein VF510_17325 [Ktedonobacterales bacterium]